MRCVTCQDELPRERVDYGYDYCIKSACVAQNFTGVRVVEVGVNKSAPQLVAADEVDDALNSTRFGEHAKKNATLGSDDVGNGSVHPGRPTSSRGENTGPSRAHRQARTARPTRRKRWTGEQEKIVTVFNEMGLRPQEMIERAPHLGLTVSLITEIVCSVKK